MLIDVKIEKTDFHKHIETTRRRTLTAKSDNVENSVLALIRVLSAKLFVGRFKSEERHKFDQRKVKRIILETKE